MKLLFTNWRKARKDQIENGKYYGGKKGEYFRCVWCGKKFQENDEYNILITTNIRSDYWKHISGNPLICHPCFRLYGSIEELISELEDRVHELHNLHENRYWWFLRK